MRPGNTRTATTSPEKDLPEDYPEFIVTLKNRIRSAQIKAAVSVNRELVLLYWQIGRDLEEKVDAGRWGAKVIDTLARDLQSEFPGTGGFSRTNLYRMRAFFCNISRNPGNCPTGCGTNQKPTAGTGPAYPGRPFRNISNRSMKIYY